MVELSSRPVVSISSNTLPAAFETSAARCLRVAIGALGTFKEGLPHSADCLQAPTISQESRGTNEALTLLPTSTGAMPVAAIVALLDAAVVFRAQDRRRACGERPGGLPRLWAHTAIARRLLQTGSTRLDLAAVQATLRQ
jgi:hypothetical protein